MLIALTALLLTGVDAGVDDDAGIDAGESDGGFERVIYDVVEGDLTVRSEGVDGGILPLHVTEGCWLDTRTCVNAGKEKAFSEHEVQSLETGWIRWLGVAFGAGVAAGTVVGLVVGFHVWHK